MSNLSFTVLRGPWWAAGGGPFVDDVTVEDPSEELVRLAHHAHAAGVIDLHDVTDEALSEHGVQTQEEAESALTDAMGEWDEEAQAWTGPWAEGNQLVYEETKAALAAEVEADVERGEGE